MTERVEIPLQHATSVIAAAGVLLPVWWPSLAAVSSFAAEWLPILGAVWLIVQIVRAIVYWGRMK